MRIILIVLFLCFSSSSWSMGQLSTETDDSPLLGKPAPAFTLPLLNLSPSTSSNSSPQTFSPKQLAGKVWILNVWASWCGPCRAELPVLIAFSRTIHVPIIGLNYTDSREDATQWLAKFGNPYSLIVEDSDGKVGTDYGVVGVPETFVIDKKGVIRFRFVGPVTPELIKDKLRPLLDAQ